MNLKEYIQQQNAEAQANGSCFTTVEDLEHWASYGVHTVEDYILYNTRCELWDLYKDVTGVRPRHLDLWNMPLEEVQSEINSLQAQLERELQWEAEAEAQAKLEESAHESAYESALSGAPLTQSLAI